ncbi:MAG: ABC transporter permease subunit [Spirochaetaceae bacterium]|jgi:peptide/nickel transport system permease protein|nr:ABC transporter permease subunit [Spirochaetaceae bacterium]
MRKELLNRFLEQKTAVLGASIIFLLLMMGLSAKVIAPHDPYAVDLTKKLLLPCAEFPLGSDQLGRCIFSRIVFGIRTSLATAFVTTILIVLIGVPLGIVAGYIGGIMDSFIMRLTDIVSTFPSSLLALAVVGVFGPSLPNLILVFVGLWWAPFARIVRGTVKKLKESDFVLAAITAGDSHITIIMKHIMINAISPVIVLATLRIAAVIVHVAGFSFIGLGSQPPISDWGVMLNDARQYLTSRPLMMLWPGLAIMISVCAFNMLGEGMNEAFLPTSGEGKVKEDAGI